MSSLTRRTGIKRHVDDPEKGCLKQRRYSVKVYRLLVREADSLKGEIDGPESAKPIVREYFNQVRDDREHFVALALTTKSQLIGIAEISTGGTATTIVDPKVLFRTLLVMGAARFILAHNHPSSDTTPSREDYLLTKNLRDAGQLLELECLDHLIIGDGNAAVYSFAENGQMN